LRDAGLSVTLNIVKQSEYKSTAICILGMHRSGTSILTRTINLLGPYLGEEAKICQCGPDNPTGFWEHLDICDFHFRLLKQFNRTWDTAAPLPDQWHKSGAIRPFKEELIKLVKTRFDGRPLWAWKDPRTCLFMPLWREALDELGIRLVCVFVTRNPMDVACSLNRRDSVPPGKALGVWFNYNLAALRDTAGVPMAFVGYEQFLSNWETELRRCATAIGLDWPEDEQQLREAMTRFIRPDLCHNRSSITDLQGAPHPVQELYRLLNESGTGSAARDKNFDETVNRLAFDFQAYASFFPMGVLEPRPGRVKRTWQRWQKSFRKRFRIPNISAHPRQDNRARASEPSS
jgi:hypothetical protein